MTVQNTIVKNIYAGNGSNTSWPYTFECPKEHPEFIKVFVRNVEGVLSLVENYLVDTENKNITYPIVYPEPWEGSDPIPGEPLAEGEKIVITRQLPLHQYLNLIDQGPFYAENIETTFDEVVMMIQQLNEKAERTVSISVDTDQEKFNLSIPIVPGKSFRINDEGTAIETTEDPAKVIGIVEGTLAEINETVEEAQAAVDKAKDLLKYQSITPQYYYEGEIFADGTPDWTNAIQKAFNTVRDGDINLLYFPSGTYVTRNLASGYSANIFSHDVIIKGDNAYIKLADNTIVGDNQRLFTIRAADDQDIVVRISGLTIDMNKENNAAYYDESHAYLQHCHAISVYGNTSGSVDVIADNLRFFNLIADGISFAGNEVNTHNSINVSNVISDGNGTNLRSCICQTADFKELNIDNCDVARLEIETNAVNDNPKRTVNISNCNIKNGLDLLIKSKAENVVNINNVRVTNRLFLQGGVFNVSNSYFATNRPTRVLLGDFYFDNCTFTTVNDTEWEPRDGYSYYMYVTSNYSAGDVVFNNCKLKWSNPNVSYLFASQSYPAFDTIRFADSDIDVTNGIAVRHGKIELYNNKINYLNGVAFVVYASTSNDIKYVKMYNNVTDNPNAYLYHLNTDNRENIIFENNPAWNMGKVFYTTRLDRFTPVNGGTGVSWSIYETTTFTNDAAPTEGVWIKGQAVKNRMTDGSVVGWVNTVNSRTGGVWEAIINDSISAVTPEAFGAVGDGVAYDDEAISAALSYAENNSTKTVALNKSYHIHSGISNVPNYVNIVGNGKIYSDEDCFNLDGIAHVKIEGLKLYPNRHGLVITSTKSWSNYNIFNDLFIYNSHSTTGDGTCGIKVERTTKYITEQSFTNCVMWGFDYGIRINNPSTDVECSTQKFTRCSTETSKTFGQYLTNTSDNSFIECRTVETKSLTFKTEGTCSRLLIIGSLVNNADGQQQLSENTSGMFIGRYRTAGIYNSDMGCICYIVKGKIIPRQENVIVDRLGTNTITDDTIIPANNKDNNTLYQYFNHNTADNKVLNLSADFYGGRGKINSVWIRFASGTGTLTFKCGTYEKVLQNKKRQTMFVELTWNYVNNADYWRVLELSQEWEDKIYDVQINGTSITENGVANIPLASNTNFGLFKPYNGNVDYGLYVESKGAFINKATNAQIDARANAYRPIVSNNLDYAVKQAMCDGKGAEWTEDEKASARERLGADGGNVELIASVKITEDVDKIELNIVPLKAIYITVKTAPYTSASQLNVSCRLNTIMLATLYSSNGVNTTTRYSQYIWERRNNNMWFGIVRATAGTMETINSLQGTLDARFIGAETNAINSVLLKPATSGVKIANGSEVYIYGVKAQ